jgi:hypothetical protein
MHNLFAGLMGIFMGLGSFFHGGAATHHAQLRVQANVSGTPEASPSSMMSRDRFEKLPAGERPFYGTVTAVNGSTLTVSLVRGLHLGDDKRTVNSTVNSTATPPTQTVTIHLDSSTKYTGGTQSDITTNTRIAGFGKSNSDGSLNAVSIIINPTTPSRMPRPSGMLFRRGMGQGHGDDGRGFGRPQ